MIALWLRQDHHLAATKLLIPIHSVPCHLFVLCPTTTECEDMDCNKCKATWNCWGRCKKCNNEEGPSKRFRLHADLLTSCHGRFCLSAHTSVSWEVMSVSTPRYHGRLCLSAHLGIMAGYVCQHTSVCLKQCCTFVVA
jgi:hypothetical protein